MRAFLHPCDGHAFSALGPLLVEHGWEVVGTAPLDSCPSWAACVSEASSTPEDFQRLVGSVDLFILHLPGHEADVRHVLSVLNQTPPEKQQVIVAVTGPMSWGSTLPADLMAEGADNSSPEPISDQHLPRRQCSYLARKAAEVEHAILHTGTHKLRQSYVVCPGLLYGAGECDSGLASLFRTAWEGDEPVPVYGDGTNLLPLLHVQELASYVVSLVNVQPKQQYFLVAEAQAVKQSEVAAAIARGLGSGATRMVSRQDVFLTEGIAQFLLDLPISTTALPPRFQHTPHQPFLEAISGTVQEYLERRQLTPLKLLLMGPPMAGKSTLAKQLAQQYGLPCLDAQMLVAAIPEVDAQLQQVMKAELASKEPRLSDRSMAKLLFHCTSRLAKPNRGWVLEGWPKTLAQAQLAFAAEIKEEVKVTPEKGKPGAAAALQSTAASIPNTPSPLPTHLIQVSAPEGELRRRMEAIADAELRAAKLAAPPLAPPPAAKGAKAAKEVVPVVPGHNNPKDFQRRLDAYNQQRQADANDLQVKVVQSQKDWEQQQQQKQAAAAQALANESARTRARRLPVEGATSSSSSSGAAEQEQQQEQGPELPEHGGFVAFFTTAGVRLVAVDNADDKGDVGALAASQPSAGTAAAGGCMPAPVHTAATLAAAKEALGAPHNFEGFSPIPDSVGREQSTVGGPIRGDEGSPSPWISPAEEAQYDTQEQEAAAAWGAQQDRWTKARVEPFKLHLLTTIMPAVTDALMEIARCRPIDPVEVLADYLEQAAAASEAQHEDPYSAPVYAERLEKHAAKAAREAARAAAAAARPEGAST